MKSLLFVALLLTAPLAADSLTPTAGSDAAAIQAVASMMATPRPTPAPSPSPVAADSAVAHAGFYVPSWSAALHVAGAMPLGDLSTYNGLGFGVQVDAIYHAAPGVGVLLFAVTSQLPSIDPMADGQNLYVGGSVPTGLLGLGLKGAYTLYQADQMRLIVDAGLGYGSLSRTHRTVTWQADTQTQSALLLCGGVEVTYQIVPALDLVMAMDFVAADLAGGTGDMPQIGLPSVGVQYDFD